MHLKTILSLSLILFANISVFAQTKNVDIDNLRFNVAYRNTPEKPLDPMAFSYTTKANASKSTERRVSTDEINLLLYITGQQKVDDDAAVILAVSLGDLFIKSSNVKERMEQTKDKDGKVTGTHYYYKLVVIYTFESSYKIAQGNKILQEGGLHYRDRDFTYESSEYRTRKEAADLWNNNKDVFVSDFTTQLSKAAAGSATALASRLYGFPAVQTNDIIETTDEKKHNENEAFRNACNKLKTELESMTPEKGLNKDNIVDVIEYFKSIPPKYTDKKLKADIKLRYAAYFNLCKIFLYLDEPENVREYATLLIENDYDKKDGEKFIKAAEEVRAVLTRSEINTRHFNPDDFFQ
ncbi:MAG: hypothetical protein LBT27_09630 [Prevotellaceae bacterium]|jgi:hypothetical protein|nr:hypothetical protein [Prevotellaceae bacterium]